MTKAQKTERDEAIARLREWVKPGDTVHTIIRHVSRSGMQREIGVVLIDADGSTLHPNWAVSKAIGARQGKRDGVIMGGCGMDMGFALVYELSHALFPDGFGCVGDKCPSNDHSNGDRDRTPHGACKDCLEKTHEPSPGHEYTHWHTSGGYALRQRWL